MHVSSLTSPLSLDPNPNSDSYFSPIEPSTINSQLVTPNNNYYHFPNFNWSYLGQLLVTVLVLGFGFLHFLRSTASKYFAVDSASAMPAAAGKEGCAVCGKSTKLWCSACKAVYYCSPACQLEHWKAGHKTNCKRSSGALKSQQHKGGKAKSPVAASSSVPVKRVDKVLFSYDEFGKLFHSDLPTTPPCGLLNCGNSCFANVVLQCLAHTRPLVAYLLEKGHRRDCKRNEWCFLCELEAHMDRARKSQQPFSPINILSRLPTMGGNMGHGRQEDAHEFMRFAIDMMQSVCLDEHGGEKVILPKCQETTLIQHIFGGQLRSQVKCTRCYHVSNRYENMMDLTVEIQGDATSLQDCLDQFTTTEWLHGENKYQCDRCKAYVNARKRLTIHQAPNILTVTLKRFQGGNFGKINKRVTFPESLDLCPYMSEERDGTDKYELYAVVVHMDMLNASYFGHYICYTKGFQGDWYWIDDCKVERVELEEVLSQGAYMLLYRRISARPHCLRTGDIAMNKDHEGDKMESVGEDNSPTLKTCDPAMNKDHEGDKMDIVRDDNSPSIKACGLATSKDHDGDKMDIVAFVGDDNSPCQIASSSNLLDPIMPLSTAVCEPMDGVSEDSRTSPPDSNTSQQLDNSGSALVAVEESARKVEESIGNAEDSVLAPADWASDCEPSGSINGSGFLEQRSAQNSTRKTDCTTLNF